MPKGTSQPGKIHLRIIEVMKRFPEGISGGQIRQELEKEGLRPEDLRNLRRQIEELDKWFIVEKIVAEEAKLGESMLVRDQGEISQELRAKVLYAARGHCQMCRRTIQTDAITLVVTRKRRTVSGATFEGENLWAICEECFARKKVPSRLPLPVRAGARPKFKRCGMSISRRKRQYEP